LGSSLDVTARDIDDLLELIGGKRFYAFRFHRIARIGHSALLVPQASIDHVLTHGRHVRHLRLAHAPDKCRTVERVYPSVEHAESITLRVLTVQCVAGWVACSIAGEGGVAFSSVPGVTGLHEQQGEGEGQPTADG
jgi:hypothetical protein